MAEQIPRSVLAFAYLADHYARTADLATGLVPLFAPIVSRLEGRRFEPAEFAAGVKELYGISMHPYAAEALAPMLARSGMLNEKRYSPGASSYHYAKCSLPEIPFTESDVQRVCSAFHDFACSKLSAVGLSASVAETQDAFLSRLTRPQFMRIILRPDREQVSAKTLTLKRSQDKDDEVGPEGHFDYLVARFLTETIVGDTKEAELMVGISSGALLSQVVLDLRDPPKHGEHLPGLKVVIDTSLICDALDLGLEHAQPYAKLLIEQVKQAGAEPVIFDYTLDEIRRVLRSPLENYEQRRAVFGPLGRRLMHRATFPALLRRAISTVRADVEQLGVRVMEYDSADRQRDRAHFTETLEREMSGRLGDYPTESARDHDARAIADILRLRGPDRASSLRAAKYVFVTRNGRLAALSRRFLDDRALAARDYFPPCITDRFLSGLLWIALGGGENRLSRLQLVANCSAVLVPRREVVSRMHGFLADLTPQSVEKFDALMTNERIENFLMDRTMADPMVITENNFEAIYEELEEEAAHKVAAKKDAEIERLRAEHAAQTEALTERHRAERERVATEAILLGSELSEAQSQAKALARERDERDLQLAEADARWMRLIVRAGKRKERAAWAVMVIALAGLSAVVGSAAPTNIGTKAMVALVTFVAVSLLATVGNKYWLDNRLDQWIAEQRDSAAWSFAEKHDVLDVLGRHSIDWERSSFKRKG
jgi:hypothetical protein